MNHGLFWASYFFAVGAAVGSFLNVVIYRLPVGESIVRPGSRCPVCKTPIKWYHNIPIASYFILRGKCAACHAPFSPRYMLVELLTALLFMACWARFGVGAPMFVFMTLIAALVAVFFIDLDHMIIPDVITLPGIPIGFVLGYFVLHIPFTDSLIGFLAGGGIFFVLAVLVPGGMGGGDIKFMAFIGALLGWKAALITIFLGSLIGAIGGVAGMLFFGKGRKIPFGPYLVLGVLIAVFWQREVIDLYFSLFVPGAP
ncbi:MAG: prepilin peptidase [Nitrospinae bacterium]|nr:prepilin peptidase [Nitrospinota bacterium]